MQKFVKVAVNLPTSKSIKAFTYSLEPSEDVSIGSVVVVEFRNSYKAGYVVGFDEKHDIEKIKPIISVVEELGLNKEDRKLAEWIAKNYITSQWSATRLFQPPGSNLNVKEEFSYKDNGDFKKAGKTAIEKHFGKNLETLLSENTVFPTYKLAVKEPKKLTYLKVIGRVEKDMTDKQSDLLRVVKENGIILKKEALEKAGSSISIASGLIKKGLLEQVKKPYFQVPDLDYKEAYAKPDKLTGEQERAIMSIGKSISAGENKTYLLNGITGSGKTEVYSQAIEKVLKKGKSAILLVPEIAMSVQVVARLRSRFSDKVAILHSGLTAAQRLSQYKQIKDGKFPIVIGARSAVFAPVKDLRLIIVDEEHEGAYKQNRAPRYHARDVAVRRAQIANAVCVLGSATPSLESRFAAEKDYGHLILKTKPVGSSVNIELADMRELDEKSLLSSVLVRAMKETLAKNQKVLLLLNRRGFSSFLLCTACGFVAKCKRCSVSLTYHKTEQTLKCHHCDYTVDTIGRCPECASTLFRYAGSGTQKLEQKVTEIFARELVVRLDRDNTGNKSAAQALNKFRAAKRAILLGTQIVGKGLDFKEIALVGIVNADTSLNFPDFRAGERTFQLLHQVAGRSGRGSIPGRVIIQTYNSDHYAIQAALKDSYEDFYKQEIEYRKELGYPPLSRLINVGFSSLNVEASKQAAHGLAEILRDIKEIEVLGPVAAPISVLKHRHRWHILIKFSQEIPEELRKTLAEYDYKNVTVSVDVDPQSLL